MWYSPLKLLLISGSRQKKRQSKVLLKGYDKMKNVTELKSLYWSTNKREEPHYKEFSEFFLS